MRLNLSSTWLVKKKKKMSFQYNKHLKIGDLRKLGMGIEEVSISHIIFTDLLIGVTDLAWCPDNLHFASCGVDS